MDKEKNHLGVYNPSNKSISSHIGIQRMEGIFAGEKIYTPMKYENK